MRLMVCAAGCNARLGEFGAINVHEYRWEGLAVYSRPGCLFGPFIPIQGCLFLVEFVQCKLVVGIYLECVPPLIVAFSRSAPMCARRARGCIFPSAGCIWVRVNCGARGPFADSSNSCQAFAAQEMYVPLSEPPALPFLVTEMLLECSQALTLSR